MSAILMARGCRLLREPNIKPAKAQVIPPDNPAGTQSKPMGFTWHSPTGNLRFDLLPWIRQAGEFWRFRSAAREGT